jgi:hypothetical protein
LHSLSHVALSHVAFNVETQHCCVSSLRANATSSKNESAVAGKSLIPWTAGALACEKIDVKIPGFQISDCEKVHLDKQMPTNKSILKTHFQNVAHIAFVVPRCI